MKLKYIGINNVTEDTEIVLVNATTLKINGVYKQIDSTSVQFPTITDDYIQSITFDGTDYNVTVLRKYTQNNSSWYNLGMVDMSSTYTNETVTNPVTITGLTQAEVNANNVAEQISSIKSQLVSLDLQVPRIVEDMLPSITGFTPNASKQTIISEKQSLRVQLATLQGT